MSVPRKELLWPDTSCTVGTWGYQLELSPCLVVAILRNDWLVDRHWLFQHFINVLLLWECWDQRIRTLYYHIYLTLSQDFQAIGRLPMCVLSYIFAWHRGSSGQPPWVRLSHSLGHCHLTRLCKIYSAQRYETVNGLATNVPLHYPELNWSGCLYDLNVGIKNEWNKI